MRSLVRRGPQVFRRSASRRSPRPSSRTSATWSTSGATRRRSVACTRRRIRRRLGRRIEGPDVSTSAPQPRRGDYGRALGYYRGRPDQREPGDERGARGRPPDLSTSVALNRTRSRAARRSVPSAACGPSNAVGARPGTPGCGAVAELSGDAVGRRAGRRGACHLRSARQSGLGGARPVQGPG